MNSYQISRKAALLISFNWISFAICFAWTSRSQGSLLWWRDLNWSGWLTDLAGIIELTPVPAGALWILWFVAGGFFSAMSWNRKPDITEAALSNDAVAKRQLLGNAEMMETHPELKEKILRLHQSLDNI